MSRSQGPGRQASGFSTAIATSQGASGATIRANSAPESSHAERICPVAGETGDQARDQEEDA